jgi:hypothetical protein
MYIAAVVYNSLHITTYMAHQDSAALLRLLVSKEYVHLCMYVQDNTMLVL